MQGVFHYIVRLIHALVHILMCALYRLVSSLRETLALPIIELLKNVFSVQFNKLKYAILFIS